jgi:hypothetical protein
MAMKWTEPRLLAAGTSAAKSKRRFSPLAACALVELELAELELPEWALSPASALAEWT